MFNVKPSKHERDNEETIAVFTLKNDLKVKQLPRKLQVYFCYSRLR